MSYSNRTSASKQGSSSPFSPLIRHAKTVPILEIAGQHFPDFKRAGRCHMARCPFHDDKTASLALYTDTNSFYCFACAKGGDVIRFVELLHNCGFKEAVTRLTENSYVA